MVEMKPGPELDRAVAEAIGWKFTAKAVVRNRFDELCGTNLEGWWDGDKYVAYETPLFSTDLNAAFAAAFSVGLFNAATLGPFVLRPGKRRSFVVRETLGGEDEALFAYGDTPALAIAASILKLKEETPAP